MRIITVPRATALLLCLVLFALSAPGLALTSHQCGSSDPLGTSCDASPHSPRMRPPTPRRVNALSHLLPWGSLFPFSRVFNDLDWHMRELERAFDFAPFWDVLPPAHRIAPSEPGAAAALSDTSAQAQAPPQPQPTHQDAAATAGERPLSVWGTLSHAPMIDVSERDDAFLVNVDVPGVKKGDVKIHIDDHHGHKTLTVSGERREETSREDKDKGLKSWSRSYGRFSRSLALPDNVNAENITAKHEDGVLRLVVPKQAAALKPASREIPVA